MLYYRSKQGDMVDQVVWQHYGRQNDLVVETVLQANPGLADFGPTLTEGVQIALPEIADEQDTGSVRLWG